MHTPRFLFRFRIWLWAVSLVIAFRVSAATPQNVIIVAGQSNALNWHASAAELPEDPVDRTISFYYETGAPPARGGPTPFNATSDGKWVGLGAQHQEPFVKYEHDFFGPEISLARALAKHSPTRLAVIKLAYFGTNLAEDWQPGARSGNQLYARLTHHVEAALQALRAHGHEPRLIGFFWMQGETDGAKAEHAAAYFEHLTDFIARVRSDLSSPELPFVLGRVGPKPPKGYPEQDRVRAAQVRVAKMTPGVSWVDTDDLGRYSDGVHLLAPGILTLGERMAKAWQDLSKNRPATALTL